LKRPAIDNIKTGVEFKSWYWLKSELVLFCKNKKIPCTGAKFDLVNSIANFIEHGQHKIITREKKQPHKPVQPWSSKQLTLATTITANYTNGPNSRRFFKQYCGENFQFSIPFMAFMRANAGKKLSAAVAEWKRLAAQKTQPDFKTIIPPGNQFNQYIRDFFADNPKATIQNARLCWQKKKALPVALHRYERSDLFL
jgi:Domain of unknown function (DUF6434)/SAP domain-containing new25